MKVVIQRAGPDDVRDLTVMTGEYRAEMMAADGVKDGGFHPAQTAAQLSDFLENADYVVLIARSVRGHPLGYLTLFESHPFRDRPEGALDQLYVREFYRRRRIARRLIGEARDLASKMQWRRLVVKLPTAFRLDAALAFLEKQGFIDPGARKQGLLV